MLLFQINSATLLLDEFISRNYTEDLSFPEEDEQYLYTRNVFNKLQEAHDVKINAPKGKNVATIRGEKINVIACIQEFRKILLGDEEYAVTKVIVPQLAIGLIIGKGGSGISQLEQKHKSVTISIYRSTNCLCLRGPHKAVEECRGTLVLKIAAAIVSQPIVLTPSDYETLKKSTEIFCSIQDETSVQLSMSESILKIKGPAGNVSEAQGLVEELLQGIYKATVYFDSAMMKQIELCINQDLIDLIAMETKCSLVKDAKHFSIIISGKRINVRKAKTLMMDALTSSLPENFMRIKISKPLVKAVNGASTLASISAKSGSSIYFDIDILCIVIQSSIVQNNKEAMDLLQALLTNSQRLIFVYQLEQSDSWILAIMNLIELTENIKSTTQCVLQSFHEDMMISITGPSEDSVNNARKMLENAVYLVRKENIIMDIPDEAMAAFLGRKNVNMNALARDHGAFIERLKKSPNRIRIHGDNIISAVIAIKNWLQNWEEKNGTKPSLFKVMGDNNYLATGEEESLKPLEVLADSAFVEDPAPFRTDVGTVPDRFVVSNQDLCIPKITTPYEGMVDSAHTHDGVVFSAIKTETDIEFPSYAPVTSKAHSIDESSKTTEVRTLRGTIF